jgi:hypothetical protein
MYKFYPTLTFQQSLDHWQPNWDLNDPYTYRQWYEEDIQGKDTLLVMIGDSWTWGDHLGVIDWDKASNDPCRMEQIAGRKLSNLLNADWVNIAKPGCSNYWMLEQLTDIRNHLTAAKEKYKKIYVIVNLTEDLRESTYTRRINVDPVYIEFWNKSNSIAEFLIKVEANLFLNLDSYFKDFPFVEAHIARVFTDVLPGNTSSLLLNKTWCDVIQDKIQFNNYLKPVPFIGQMSINPLNEKFMSTLSGNTLARYKEEFLIIMESVGSRWNFLGASEYNLKGSTCHPNPDGHRLWAEYLYSQIS